MKSALELHVQVNQKLNKIGIFRNDSFLKEEIDLVLNKAQDRYIRNIFNRRFEDREIISKFLDPILVKNRRLTAFVPQTSDPFYEPNSVYAQYPSNLLYLVNDRSSLSFSNNPSSCDNIYPVPTTSESEYTAVVEFRDNEVAVAPFYTSITITLNGNTIYSLSGIDGLNDVNTQDNNFLIIENILDTINLNTSLDYQLYYERYRETYQKDSFIFVSSNPAYNGQSLVLTITHASGSVTSTSTVVSTDYQKYDVSNIPQRVDRISPNRLTQSEELYNILQTPFFRPKITEPVSNDSSDRLFVYNTTSFAVTQITIDYIRTPRTISLSLDQGIDLGGDSADMIIDLAVELLKVDVRDPTSEINTQDIELRNNLN